MTEEKHESLNFLEELIETDIKNGKFDGRIQTRFPPEPNGYLHIGHAKAIWINFSLAQKYGGKTNLRFDDTNPTTEETEYVDSIKKDIQWLGYQWHGDALYASDYFEDLHAYAVHLIKDGHAYVDHSTAEEMADQKGNPTTPGTPSIYRNRSVDENLQLFEKMKNGEFADGACVLRAKIDLASPNMLLRDPVIYRIKHEVHHRTGSKWVIYPMYDFAHGQSDSIEAVTHSLCSLEFMHHRPLYNWFIEKLGIFPSQQTEFARMNVTYMITSKRKLLKLVQEKYVESWDDPRMPTLSGMRRRGYPAKAIIKFCEKTGVAKRNNLIEIELLESCVREELNTVSTRRMVVKDPIKLVITNFPEGEKIMLEAENNPEMEGKGHRMIPFERELFIEREDFMEDAPKGYFRLTPGGNVRLKHAYIITCTEAIKNEQGEVIEVRAIYADNSKSGQDVSGLKAKGTIHWVAASHTVPCEIREYERLFTDPSPADHIEEGKDVFDFYNPDSLKVVNGLAEAALVDAEDGEHFQFLRLGYYIKDKSSTPKALVFNRTITLKDGWKK